MNVTNYISFDKNLIENETCTITYSGFLFKNNSESVTLVYGFDSNWNNSSEVEMKKNDNGFIAEIKILSFKTLNFCFRNSNYEWDNNYNNNFSVSIQKSNEEENFIINEEILDDLVDKITNQDISTTDTTILKEEVDALISEVENAPIEILESVQENSIASFEVAPESEEFVQIEDSIGTIEEETSLDADINNIFNDFYQEDNSNQTVNTQVEEIAEDNSSINDIVNVDNTEENLEETSAFKFEEDISDLETDKTVDNLIDNLISDIYKKANTSDESETNELDNQTHFEEPSLIETIQNENVNEENQNETDTNNKENTSTALIETDNLDNYLVSPRSLSKFYMMKKKIKLAFLKVLSLPKLIISSLTGENDN